MRNPQNKRTWKSWRGEKKKRWRWGWWRPAKTLRRVQLNSPNGLAYHLFTHMLYVPMLWTPARYRLQNIETCVLTDVRRFEKPQRRDHAFFALRQKSRFLYVSLLWHVLTTRLSANHRTSERNNNSRLGTLIFIKNYPIFSKTLAVDKSFWTATNTSPTAWVKKGSYSTYGSWRHLFLC